MSPWTVAAAAVVAGLLSALAFDPFAVPGAGVVGLAVLFATLRAVPALRGRTVLALGLLHGLVFFGVAIWWMRAVSDGAYVGLVIGEAVLLAVVTVGLRQVAALGWWPVLMPAVWVLGETLRGSFPFSGFPWARLAHTSVGTPVESWVRVLGVPGTSFLLALAASGLVLAATTSGLRRVVPVLGIVAVIGVGLVLPTGVADPGESRRFALVQGDVPGEFLTWPRGKIFELHAAQTQRLADRVTDGDTEAPDAVLWPENATDVDPSFAPGVRGMIEDLSAQIGAPILVGGLFDGPTSDTVYNAGVVWDEDGPGERYVKRKPVAYGEYVPFRDTLGDLVPRIDRDIPRDMLPGDEVGSLTIGDVQIGDTICYDIAFDGVVRDAVTHGAQVIVVQTSNAAFTGTAQPEQQWDISRLRAIETGRWVLVPSTNGISGVIDADGRVVERAPLGEPATIEVDVPLASGTTPAIHTARPLGWLIVTLGVMGWVVASVVRRRDQAGHSQVAGGQQ